MSTTEPTVWQYRLAYPNGRWLADVVLRSDGFFAAVSDWGNYAFRWTRPGMEFRAFVAQLEGQHDYVCSKLARRDWYDGEGTLKNIKRRICENRREGSWSKEKAAKEWQVLADACWPLDGLGREIDLLQFHRFYETTSIQDASELARYDFPTDVRGFCQEVMPVLAAAIRAELAADTRRECTCTGSCKGAAGLSPGWKCALEKSRPGAAP